MCPFAVDEERMQQKPVAGQDTSIMLTLDPHKPPTKFIPHADFPCVVYKHPLEPSTTIEHRNARHELVQEEIVPTEHLTMRCADKAELKKAIEDGWVKEPYVPETPPDKKVALYGKHATKA